jgi:UDP-3-O-acyl-N-acetylglucosamine deacetylase
MNTIYSGRVDFIYEVSGSWQLQKDSLVLKVNPNISYKVDDSHITYKPELRDSVKAMVNYWNMTIKTRVEQFKKNVTRAAFFASINNVGNRIQLISSEENKQEGNNENYLTREE